MIAFHHEFVNQGCEGYFDGDGNCIGVCCIEGGRNYFESVYGTECKIWDSKRTRWRRKCRVRVRYRKSRLLLRCWAVELFTSRPPGLQNLLILHSFKLRWGRYDRVRWLIDCCDNWAEFHKDRWSPTNVKDENGVAVEGVSVAEKPWDRILTRMLMIIIRLQYGHRWSIRQILLFHATYSATSSLFRRLSSFGMDDQNQ